MRIRTIKPEFWASESLSEQPEPTHLLAAALLNYADDEGYFNANAALVRAACSPLREPSVSIHDSLNRLSNVGYLRLGTGSDGRRYGHIVNFKDHQRINRPTPSKIKALDIVWEDSTTTHGVITEDSHPEGKGKEQGKEGKGTGNTMSTSSTAVPRGTIPDGDSEDPTQDPNPQSPHPEGAVNRVFAHWRTVHDHPRARLDAKRRKLIHNALKGYSEADLCQAISGYLNSPHHMGQNDRNTKYDDIELMLRDAKHIDAGLRFYANPPQRGLSTLTRRNVAATEDWVPPELRERHAPE